MVVLLGLNHRTTSVDVREKLAFSEERVSAALESLLREDYVEEGMILSTCNRVEVLVKSSRPEGAAVAVRRWLAEHGAIPPHDLNGCLYQYSGRDAVRHLFHVTSGLDSMILGEPQILGQVKRAYGLARSSGATGPILEHLLQHSFAVAKRVRTRTGISRHPVSIAYAAVELARQIFGHLTGRSVLVVGAGKMAGLTAKHLVSQGMNRLLVASRQYARAAVFSERHGGEPVAWADVWSHLGEVDVVVCGTAAPGSVLSREGVERAMRARRNRPLFIIDIAVPRDVEPAVNELGNVYLYDVDDLQHVADEGLETRRKAADEARRMIEPELVVFERWLEQLRVTPTIVALRETLLDIRAGEHDRFRSKLGSLSLEQREAVEELTRSIVQKILHRPIRQLKSQSGRAGSEDYVALYHRIFGIAGDGRAARGKSSSDSKE